MTPSVVHAVLQFQNFSAMHFEQPAGTRVPSHSHEATTALCVLDGAAVDRIGGRNYSTRAGSILLRPAGAAHTHDYRTGFRAIAVSIDAKGVEGLRVPQSPALTVAAPVVRALAEELRHRDVLQPMAVSAVVAELAALSATPQTRRGSVPPAWLLEVRALLHDEHIPRLSLAHVAAVAGVHPGHVARAFRAYFGTTLSAYSRHIRLRSAARQLLQSSSTIAEIAVQHGFCDQSHFDRLFQRNFGCSPSSFRVMFGLSKAGATGK